jgi:hypothetical protein
MARRIIEADGARWTVAPAGRTTQYGRDEFALVFRRLLDGGAPGEARVIRYSPRGTRLREVSLARLDDQQLRELLGRSQPGWTAPELGYRR